MFPTHYSDGLAVEDLPCTRLDQARPEMLDLGKPTPLLASGQWEQVYLPSGSLPFLCMTFHEIENGFEPYLRLPIGILYLYSTRCGGQGRSGTPRRTLLELLRGFSSRVFLFFPLFFFKSGARSPPGMIPRDVSLSDPTHAAGAYLSIVDPTMRVSSSYPSHRRIIVARPRRHRRRPPIYHPHTRSSS